VRRYIVLIIIFVFISAHTLSDGPYIYYEGESIQVFNIVDSTLTVTPYEKQSGFKIFEKKIPWEENDFDDSKMFVVSDIHGQYEVFLQLLQKAGIVDKSGKWIWGDNHLIVAGDVADRGEFVTDCYWFLYGLEEEARNQEGSVQMLLGNHEILLMKEDYRYVAEKYNTSSKLQKKEISELYGKNSELGRWLRKQNTIVRMNNYLIVHGGISPEISNKFTIDQINNMVRDEINSGETKDQSDIDLLFGKNGPFWYRGYFRKDLSDNEVDSILEFFNVEKIIVGHTTRDSITYLYDDKIIGVDAGMKYGDRASGILIEKDKFVTISVRK